MQSFEFCLGVSMRLSSDVSRWELALTIPPHSYCRCKTATIRWCWQRLVRYGCRNAAFIACAELGTVLLSGRLVGGVASTFGIRDSCLVESVRIGISGKAWHEFQPEKRTANVIDTTICLQGQPGLHEVTHFKRHRHACTGRKQGVEWTPWQVQ